MLFNNEQPATGNWRKTKKSNAVRKLVCFFIIFVVAIACNKRGGESFGIDVSQNNGNIDWSKVKSQKKTKDPIEFVVIRCTMGIDGIDRCYERNYKEAKKNGFIVGSYHYYRPNENSIRQFENFKNVVHLEKGDLLPVVDIEVFPSTQSMISLKSGLHRFLTLVEMEYGVKPIIYTKLSMWKDYLESEFSGYKLWVAAYSTHRRDDSTVVNADIHQFTKEIRNIPGIPSKYVDGDDARDLQSILY